jgi:serine/threonine-protein kinase
MADRARPEPPPDPALCGGRYRILGRIATGGMAEVLEGDDLVLGRRVAIKVMKGTDRPEDEGGEAAIEAAHAADRMRVEARALALVAHPNVVAAFDFGTTTDGRPFIVTERLAGRSLDAALRDRGFLPWEEAVEIVRQVLSALGAVHAKGIVHRDVKPGNVFACAGGTVKLLDFGVAKITGEAALKHLAPAYRTKKGSLVGTPKYVTPEQATGEPVDGRTDLYAVGLLAYLLVTGKHAFAEAESVDEMLAAMRARGVRLPSACAPQPIPAWLDRAILKALSWEAAARFQSAAAFAEALGEGAGDEDLDEPTHAVREDRSLPAVVLAAAFVVSAALAFAVVLLAGGRV